MNDIWIVVMTLRTTQPWQHRVCMVCAHYNGVLYTKISKLTDVKFKGEINYHATAHCTIKWSRFIPNIR